MIPRRTLTAAEKRVLSTLRRHGPAVRIWRSNRQDNYSWWIAGQPVTRIVHSLAVKGYLRVERDEAHLTAPAILSRRVV
jgi:DNA-binding MarR family transcriptional regulator